MPSKKKKKKAAAKAARSANAPGACEALAAPPMGRKVPSNFNADLEVASPTPSVGNSNLYPGASFPPPGVLSNDSSNPNLIPVATRRPRPSTPEEPSVAGSPQEDSSFGGQESLRTSPSQKTFSPMAPAAPLTPRDDHAGPHPSFIEVAKPYVFEQQIQACMAIIHMNDVREASMRLQGVNWIDQVRKALQLSVITYRKNVTSVC